MTSLILPREARAQIESHASAAWPRECCGLIEGARVGGAVVVTAVHPMRNLAPEPDAFEIDPTEHIGLLRALRGGGTALVGCYHSHPNGDPKPSLRDRGGAGEVDFVWLIASLSAPGAVALQAYRFDGTDFAAVSLIATASLDPARRPRL